MALRNHSIITEFILTGLSDNPHIQALLFVLFLVIYLLTVMGNLTMLLVIRADSHLHTPMYFFLSNLSFLDLCFSSVTVPKLLKDLLSEKKTISVEGCLTQVFFVFITAGTEAFLLSMMAYDRYAAICHPLLYGQLMSIQLCVKLILASWGLASLNSVIIVLLAVNLDFCEAQTIHHYTCELPSLFPLSCSDVSINIDILICSILHGAPSYTWSWNLPPSLLLLCSHCLHHPEHQLHHRQKQGLLHLLLPPHRSDPVLWVWFDSLSHAHFRFLPRFALILAVQCSHTHAEPPHLQSKEHGGEGSCEKDIGEIPAIF